MEVILSDLPTEEEFAGFAKTELNFDAQDAMLLYIQKTVLKASTQIIRKQSLWDIHYKI